jgi:glycosyltransferase involved in cell wall biosynthesis
MHITFVITGLGMGGAEVQVSTLAAGFSGRGATVQIVSMLSKIAAHPQLSAKIPISTLGMTRGKSTPGDLVRYVKTVRAHRPDIVHSHLFHANLLARIGRPFVRTPLVCTAHNTAEHPEQAKNASLRTRFRELAYRWTDPLCDLTTQVSAEGAERYVAIGATPASKMQFVPNAVDCQRFRPDAELRTRIREELRLGDAFTWIWIGRIEEQKDPWTILQAFQIAAASDPSCALLVVGSGSLEKRMQQRAAELGISSQVRFLGLRQDIPALLNGADGYVLSSIREGFPMVLLEASASGLPLVVTSPGAEAVVPERSGWVVGTRDPDALAERMRALMGLSPDKRRAMGAEGRKFVSSKFALDAVLDTWERVYASLLKKTRFEMDGIRSSA